MVFFPNGARAFGYIYSKLSFNGIKLTGFMTLMDANDCESTSLPPIKLGTLWYTILSRLKSSMDIVKSPTREGRKKKNNSNGRYFFLPLIQVVGMISVGLSYFYLCLGLPWGSAASKKAQQLRDVCPFQQISRVSMTWNFSLHQKIKINEPL